MGVMWGAECGLRPSHGIPARRVTIRSHRSQIQARGIRPPCDAPIASQPDTPEETGPRPNYPPPCEPIFTQRPARFAHLARLRELARPDPTPRNPSHHPDTRYCALTADGSSRRTRPAHPGPVAPPRPAPVCRQTLPPAPQNARAGPPLAPPKPTKHPKSARRTAH